VELIGEKYMKVKGEQLWIWKCKREKGRKKGNKGVHVIKVCYIMYENIMKPITLYN
jgi:hypothetical protein